MSGSERPDTTTGSDKQEAEGKPETVAGDRKRAPWFSVLTGTAMALLGVVLLAAIGLGGAEYYTARPDFCGTCHVMEPYYASWSHDLHGSKLGVRCVDCHYAPGERFTFKAKFKGLSQVASYFSGRYGASRPRAHVSDASCLVSGCHGEGEYLSKVLLIGERRMEKRFVADQEVEIERKPTVQFVHEKHLHVDGALSETVQRRDRLAARLNEALPADVFERVREVAISIGPASPREARMRSMLEPLQQPELLQDALELMRLEHRETRLKQLESLTCAACHSYNESGKGHFVVDRQTCFTCHFINQPFNHDTGECLRCHEPPTRMVLVHEQPQIEAVEPALMNHQDIVARKIDCASCHLDVIQGEVGVTLRDCQHCHDQDQYTEAFAQRTLKDVQKYHSIHVAKQRAHCEDCHRPIEHRLVDAVHIATKADFLRPVLEDCQHCHPNHHAEQVQLLMGVGGVGVERPMPSGMFGSRLNCRACHTQSGTDFKGDALVRATEQSCIACHGDDYARLFERWRQELGTYLEESKSALRAAETRLEQLRSRGETTPEEMSKLIEQARINIHLCEVGNGIHNKGYALQLLDLARINLEKAMSLAPSN